MRHYHNLLYVSHATSNESEGLKQALSLARNNNAPLKVLVICPEFPKDFPEYRKKLEESLLEQIESSIYTVREILKLDEESVVVSTELVCGQTPAIQIIQHVLRYGHDLVIKEAEPSEKKNGFKAIDMELLGKCPCAVWLSRPIQHSRQNIRVAVAIDPESHEPAAEALSERMLQLAHSLAKSCNGELQIISCWDYLFEEDLRHSVWVKVSDSEIAEAVGKEQYHHSAALESVIKSSGIPNSKYKIHHLRGKAEELIPLFTEEQSIDILVMGTVARTGIPGFILGNTAENIFQNLSCSLLALKPQGFVSPVKAY